jgi:hypothetical protein
MGFIRGANRYEEILFPERLADDITEENPVRFINAFVDHLVEGHFNAAAQARWAAGAERTLYAVACSRLLCGYSC